MRFFQRVCLSLALTLGNAGITTFAQNGNNYFLHTVSRGQSLYSIANMYHVSIDDIVRLNPGSDKQIRVGEALKIPQANSSSSSKNGRFHTIQAGETLYQLTVKYNISAQAICDANWSECQQFPRGTGNLNPYRKCGGSGHSPRSSSIFHSFYYSERMERNA